MLGLLREDSHHAPVSLFIARAIDWYFTNNSISFCIAGDVGGPLIVEGVLHGIVSWGHRCGFRGHPWVFTRVSYYLKWVKTVV